MILPSGNPFKCREEVLYLQPMIPPKLFDIFPPDWGMLRRSPADAFRFFFKNIHSLLVLRIVDGTGPLIVNEQVNFRNSGWDFREITKR